MSLISLRVHVIVLVTRRRLGARSFCVHWDDDDNERIGNDLNMFIELNSQMIAHRAPLAGIAAVLTGC